MYLSARLTVDFLKIMKRGNFKLGTVLKTMYINSSSILTIDKHFWVYNCVIIIHTYIYCVMYLLKDMITPY